MKKFLATLTALFVTLISATALAASNPTCVMMKFANDTRYQKVDSASLLSDLVLEKLLASGKFNLQETRPIDKDIEMMLYDEKMRDITNAEASIRQGNFNILFENGSFDSQHAQSIATAEVGQIVSPEIVSPVGKAHGAEYLIQGTIITMGNAFDDDELVNNNQLYLRERKSGIGVQADVRLIKTDTGEVIWRKTSSGAKTNSLTQVGMFKFGSAKLNSEMYNTAMERCAEEIVKELVKDFDAGKLFVK